MASTRWSPYKTRVGVLELKWLNLQSIWDEFAVHFRFIVIYEIFISDLHLFICKHEPF